VNKSDWKPFCELMNATAEEIGAKPKGASGLSLTFKLLSGYSLETVEPEIPIGSNEIRANTTLSRLISLNAS